MAASKAEWKDDEDLQQDLQRYVRENLKRCEILDFVQRDYPQYQWSLPTLARRLRHFEIRYIEYETPLSVVSDAIANELDGPGKLLGYRALNQKLRTQHNVKVPRHLVHNMLADMDPSGLEARSVNKKVKRKKRPYTSEGPLWVVSLDGLDKLCGYQNWTFPLGIYGCLDTYSRKNIFIFLCRSNSNPLVIGKKYLEYLYEEQTMPRHLRIDKGTGTGKMATVHVYLMNKSGIMENPVDSVIYGPSTTNKIERWWRDLHERLEKYFKEQLTQLLRGREYDPYNNVHREILFYVYAPILQREVDSFVDNWNSHRIRDQDNLMNPSGIPNHMFSFPETYGGSNCGVPVTRDQLREVAEVSGLLDFIPEDSILPRVKSEREALLSNPGKLDSSKAKDAYLYLKQNVPTR